LGIYYRYGERMTDRQDIIARNGNDGEHYIVIEVAKIMAGSGWENPLHGKNKGRKRYELYINQAMNILDYIDENRKTA